MERRERERESSIMIAQLSGRKLNVCILNDHKTDANKCETIKGKEVKYKMQNNAHK